MTLAPRHLCLLGVMGLSSVALAEGTDQLGLTQKVQKETDIYVDILDYTAEEFTWVGTGKVWVHDPDGNYHDQLDDGETFTPDDDGAWMLDLQSNQTSSGWDVEVENATDGGGRVWSYTWSFNAGAWENTLDSSVYFMVDGGSSGDLPVVEMLTDGISGFQWDLVGNTSGVDGADGRSVRSGTYSAEFPVYLNPPSKGTYTWTSPSVSDAGFSAGDQECNVIAPGYSTGDFSFVSNVDGTAHLLCDVNGDGAYDITSDDDLHKLEAAGATTNTVGWDGSDNAGDDMGTGTYDCVVLLTVGEFHFIGDDLETAFQGIRMFSVDSAGSRAGLDMFWNDTDVQEFVVEMDDGQEGLESSGPAGVNSGAYTDLFFANVNARSWGDFTATTKGDGNLLDTYTYVEGHTSAVFEVQVVSGTLDTDTDGVEDYLESCTHGTDPDDADSDDDGLSDGEEIDDIGSDPLVADSDGDGLEDGEEVNTYGSDPAVTDTDGDGLDDYAEAITYGTDPDDEDSDGDGLNDYDEVLTHGTDPNDTDTDDDGLDDYAEVITHGTDPNDTDTDDDGLDDRAEILTHGTDALDDDTDDDTLSDGDEVDVYGTDPLSTDTDSDGCSDGDEVASGTNPLVADSDSDGLGDCEEASLGTDPTDADSDDDGVSDGAEVNTHSTDPLDADSDDDGLSDGEELNTHSTDPNDPDSDEDTLSDGDEVNTYGTDPLDADTDDDGCSDADEIAEGTDPTLADTDADGIGDCDELGLGTDPLDSDSDDDGVSDGDEVNTYGSDPLDTDSDDGGRSDGDEVNTDGTDPTDPSDDLSDRDGDGLTDWAEDNTWGTDPDSADTDGDGLDDLTETEGATDPLDADSDDDGLSDGDEVLEGTDPVDPDSDDDGLSDGDEVNTHSTDPLDEDTDDDRLSDGDEVNVYGTDPLNPDTDGDGMDDADELDVGRDPLVAEGGHYGGKGISCSSTSAPSVGWFGVLGLLLLGRRRR